MAVEMSDMHCSADSRDVVVHEHRSPTFETDMRDARVVRDRHFPPTLPADPHYTRGERPNCATVCKEAQPMRGVLFGELADLRLHTLTGLGKRLSGIATGKVEPVAEHPVPLRRVSLSYLRSREPLPRPEVDLDESLGKIDSEIEGFGESGRSPASSFER